MFGGKAFEDPFNDFIAQFPMRFAQPVFFGDSPAVAYTSNLFNGTATLLSLSGRYLAITCFHVYDAYRRALEHSPATIFQVGRLGFDPRPHLISESASADLAVLDVTPYVKDDGDLAPGQFFAPGSWPPRDLTDSDILAFAGYPGVWREQLALGHLRFYSVTSGTAEIAALGEHHLVTSLALEQAETAIRDGLVIGSLGGLSGGPVFAWRTGLLLQVELIGFATEYQETWDLLYVRRANCLLEDGHIDHSRSVA